ncbi:MAG: hypothetical protein RL441_1715 [Actinomycetota bacterium]|jgi:hypothetical protein
MKLDCSTCTQRDIACGDCVVSLFLSFPTAANEIDADELAAVEVMAQAGLVPHVRMSEDDSESAKHLRIVS